MLLLFDFCRVAALFKPPVAARDSVKLKLWRRLKKNKKKKQPEWDRSFCFFIWRCRWKATGLNRKSLILKWRKKKKNILHAKLHTCVGGIRAELSHLRGLIDRCSKKKKNLFTLKQFKTIDKTVLAFPVSTIRLLSLIICWENIEERSLNKEEH